MKTYDNLWDKICTKENFRLAYNNAIKGKKDYFEVKLIQRKGVNKYLTKLLEEVESGEYKVSQYKVFHKITGGKDREIWRLPMKDRIVQHAIMIYLEPIFRESFIVDTFSSIKGRGIHNALKRVKHAIRTSNYNYALQLDIHKCYPSLDHNILKYKLAQKIKDEKLLDLLFKIVDNCDKGVPIGNYTSQYFNNYYFTAFDHWIKEVKQVKYYFRYCDDIVILGETKEELRKLYYEIKIEIEKLNVHLKPNYQIYDINARSVNLLGYKTRKDYTLIRKGTKKAFIDKVTKMDFYNLSEKDINVLGSYWGILKHADCRHLWFKYTGMKTFEELKLKIHERDFVRNIVDIPLVVTNVTIFQKKGTDWIKFNCNYDTITSDGNIKKHEDVIIGTSGELLVEAGKQLKSSDFPFSTIIKTNDKGFYQFT